MNRLDEKTESLLTDGLIKPPTEFRDSVMMNIASYEREKQLTPAPDKASQIVLPSVPWWQWAGLTVGSVIGVGQVVRFIFSMWFVTTVG